MKKNRPRCWGHFYTRQKTPERFENIQNWEVPGCPCSMKKSCIRRYDSLTRALTKAINNPRSR